jgi:hypothetical protein
MKRTLSVILGLLVISYVSIISQSSQTVETKCVQIKCSKTNFIVSMSGTSEADITKQIKQKYPDCSFTFVDKSKCKK